MSESQILGEQACPLTLKIETIHDEVAEPFYSNDSARLSVATIQLCVQPRSVRFEMFVVATTQQT